MITGCYFATLSIFSWRNKKQKNSHFTELKKFFFSEEGEASAQKDYGRGLPFPLAMWVSFALLQCTDSNKQIEIVRWSRATTTICFMRQFAQEIRESVADSLQ